MAQQTPQTSQSIKPAWIVAGVAFIVLVVGAVTLIRSDLQNVRKTDLTVYLRAAWAVQSGEDLYSVADEHGWHYHYPPLLAIALQPFALPPAEAGVRPIIPFRATVVIWYFLSVGVLFWGVHHLASAVEERLGGTNPVQWWSLRLLPIGICLIDIGSTLVRGQVNLLLLGLFCGMLAAMLRQRRFTAGLWLAAAITLKVIPAYLLLVPFARRDGRCFGGVAVGVLAFLVMIPAITLGPQRAWELQVNWTNSLLHPAMVRNNTSDRNAELLNITATDNQSLQAIIHNIRNPERATRPKAADASTKTAYLAIGIAMTLAITAIGAFAKPKNPLLDDLLFPSTLVISMLLLSPVSHLHYFCLTLPVWMGLMAIGRPGAQSMDVDENSGDSQDGANGAPLARLCGRGDGGEGCLSRPAIRLGFGNQPSLRTSLPKSLPWAAAGSPFTANSAINKVQELHGFAVLHVLACLYFVATLLPRFPGIEPFRDFGSTTFASILLFAVTVFHLAFRSTNQCRRWVTNQTADATTSAIPANSMP